MPAGYQPQIFLQFHSKGNQKQHIVHFVESCNSARTYGDYLVKQFVRSLQGNVFIGTNLEAGSIDDSKHLEHEFLDHFYSTRRSVRMI